MLELCSLQSVMNIRQYPIQGFAWQNIALSHPAGVL